jgi:hypothetical protein
VKRGEAARSVGGKSRIPAAVALGSDDIQYVALGWGDIQPHARGSDHVQGNWDAGGTREVPASLRDCSRVELLPGAWVSYFQATSNRTPNFGGVAPPPGAWVSYFPAKCSLCLRVGSAADGRLLSRRGKSI